MGKTVCTKLGLRRVLILLTLLASSPYKDGYGIYQIIVYIFIIHHSRETTRVGNIIIYILIIIIKEVGHSKHK